MARTTFWARASTIYNSWYALYMGDWESEMRKLERRHQAKADLFTWRKIYDDLMLQIVPCYSSQYLDCCPDS